MSTTTRYVFYAALIIILALIGIAFFDNTGTPSGTINQDAGAARTGAADNVQTNNNARRTPAASSNQGAFNLNHGELKMADNNTYSNSDTSWNETKQAGSNAWESTKDTASKAGDTIAEKSGDAWEATKDASGKAWDKTKEVSSDAWEATKDGASKAWDKTKEVSSDAWEATKDAAGNAADAVTEEDDEEIEIDVDDNDGNYNPQYNRDAARRENRAGY
ncbi:MAG: hypothetical protein KHX55_05900 [Proteobacteria bacterium]|nr:hypothetical protein [Pseudomonadota bacterium]